MLNSRNDFICLKSNFHEEYKPGKCYLKIHAWGVAYFHPPIVILIFVALAANSILNFNSELHLRPLVVGLHYANTDMEIEEIGYNRTGRGRRFIGVFVVLRTEKKTLKLYFPLVEFTVSCFSGKVV